LRPSPSSAADLLVMQNPFPHNAEIISAHSGSTVNEIPQPRHAGETKTAGAEAPAVGPFDLPSAAEREFPFLASVAVDLESDFAVGPPPPAMNDQVAVFAHRRRVMSTLRDLTQEVLFEVVATHLMATVPVRVDGDRDEIKRPRPGGGAATTRVPSARGYNDDPA
jgi:hypothetical protein